MHSLIIHSPNLLHMMNSTKKILKSRNFLMPGISETPNLCLCQINSEQKYTVSDHFVDLLLIKGIPTIIIKPDSLPSNRYQPEWRITSKVVILNTVQFINTFIIANWACTLLIAKLSAQCKIYPISQAGGQYKSQSYC